MQEFIDSYDGAAAAASDTVTALEEIKAKSDDAKSAVVDMLSNGISNESP